MEGLKNEGEGREGRKEERKEGRKKRTQMYKSGLRLRI